MICFIIMVKKVEKKIKNKVVIKNSVSNLRFKTGPGMARKEYSGGDFNRKQIKNLVKEQQNYMKKHGKNANMMISVYTPDGGWRAGRQFNINGDPHMFTNLELSQWGYKEWINVTQFKLYVWKPPEDTLMFAPKKGGANDKYNNCLFICICNSIGKEQLPTAYQTPWKFKKNIGLEKCDKVDIDLIPLIEDKIKVKINVKGNYEYKSDKTYNKEITVILEDGHYTLETHKKDLVKGITFKKQKPIIYKYNNDNENYDAYDGKKIIQCQEKKDMK